MAPAATSGHLGSRSLSLPTLGPGGGGASRSTVAASSSSAVALPRGADGKRALVESTLWLAPPTGTKEWEPFHGRHLTDGTVALRPRGAEGEVWVLDVDWKQPFHVAPLKEMVLGTEGYDDRVFPFSLSYAPLMVLGGQQKGRGEQRRRTLTLAAPSERKCRRWVESLSSIARVPKFRAAATQRILEDADTDLVAASGETRRTVALGEAHVSLVATTASQVPNGGKQQGFPGCLQKPGTRQPLAAGHSALWEEHTPLTCMRDLYDSYAADPLGIIRDAGKGREKVSLLDKLDSQLTPKRAGFLEKYLERQADIEGQLQQAKQGDSAQGPVRAPVLSRGNSTWSSRPEDPPRTPSSSVHSSPKSGALGERSKVEDHLAPRLSVVPLCSRTPNAVLAADRTLSVKKWSGGAIFAPPDPTSFRLTIKVVDDLATRPLFIGVVPEDANLATPNYFNGSGCGILLSLGGTRLEDELTELGAPGGPSFHIFGRRQLTVLPTPLPGGTVSVHYWEEVDAADGAAYGRMRVLVNSRTSAEPLKKHERLPQGRWRPCVMLCVPDSRVKVEHLI